MADVPDGLVETPGLEIVGGGGTRFTVPAATGKTSLAPPLVETSARLFPPKWVEAGAGLKLAPVKIMEPISGGRFKPEAVADGVTFAADAVECLLASDLPAFCPLEFAGALSCPLRPTGVGMETSLVGAVAYDPLGAGGRAFAGASPFFGSTAVSGRDFPGSAGGAGIMVAAVGATTGSVIGRGRLHFAPSKMSGRGLTPILFGCERLAEPDF
jgi:hypothetical protein